MLVRMIVLLAALGACAGAFGQDGETRREGRRPRGEFRRGPGLAALVEQMKQHVQFDEEQLARIDEIVARHEQRFAQQWDRWRALREAEQAGDEALAAELREELRTQRPAGWRGRGPESFLNEIEAILHEDQKNAFAEFRAQLPPPPERGPWDALRRVMHELPEAVRMTDEQREQYDRLLAQRRGGFADRLGRRARALGPGEPRGPKGPAEPPIPPGPPGLRQPPGPPDAGAMLDEFFDQVAALLDEEQLQLLADYRKQVEAEIRAPGPRDADDPRAVFAAARRLHGLSEEQEDAIRNLERTTLRAARQLPRSDAGGLAMLAAEARTEINNLLDEDQQAEFARILEGQRRRGPRERGGGPGFPPPPPPPPNQP